MSTPAGMTEVTREEFWQRVMSEKQNIHPFASRTCTSWDYVSSRQPWGWSSHGFIPRENNEPERFALVRVGGHP